MRIAHRTPEDWIGGDPAWLQRLARLLLGRPGRWWTRYRGYGHEPRVPEQGGFLLAPGPHGAFADPFVFGLGQPRRQLRFMAKHQVFEWPLVGRLVRWCGGFPVHRGGDRSRAALEVAERVLDAGHGVVIFMEGRLELDHDGLGTPRNGLALLALRTGLPVVPVGAYGSKRARAYGRRWWRHRPRLTVVWGEPIRVEREHDPSPERVAEVRDQVWASVTACFERARAIDGLPTGRPPSGTPLAQAPVDARPARLGAAGHA